MSKSEKIITEIESMSMMEVFELVKALETKFGVSAAMPMASAAPAAESDAAATKEEKTEFKVTLEDGGPKKLESVKALRQVTTLSLGEAKKLVESAPAVIVEAANKEDADKIKKALEAVGAVVKLS